MKFLYWELERMRGKLARIYEDKGFGFIVGDDKKEYFFHFSACPKPSFANMAAANSRDEEVLVEFTPTASDRGPRAEDETIYA